MAWYYVKSGGTATGDGGRVTTQRTGAWSGTASEYYDEIQDANVATTVPNDGDFILCSHLHSKLDAATPTGINSGGAANGAGLQIISVDNANQENYLPGAEERFNSTTARQIYQNGLIAGVSMENLDTTASTIIAVTAVRLWRFIDCTLQAGAGQPPISCSTSDGTAVILTNVDLGGEQLFNASGSRMIWRGGKWLDATSVVFNAYNNGGGGFFIQGVDLSLATSIFTGVASATSSDVAVIELVGCLLKSTVTLPADSDFTLPQHRFVMRACDDSTGGDLFRFHYQTGCGKAVNNESVFVTGEKPWGETSDKSSVEVTTTSVCSHVEPFVFDFPLAQQYIDLADSASNVLRLPITTTLTLTDTEIAAYLVYPDGTTSVQPNWVTSGKTVGAGNYGVDPLAAGTTLTTSSTTWTAAKTNKYHLELDTSGDAGQLQAVGVRIEVYRASIAANTLMLATEFEVS